MANLCLIVASLLALCCAAEANALPLVQERSSGERYFHNKNCKNGEENCDCHLNVRYLSFSEIKSKDAENKLNEALSPQSDIRSYCILEEAKAEDFDQLEKPVPDNSKGLYHYRSSQEVTFLSDNLISVIERASFDSGGAHPMQAVAAQLFDVESGTPIKDQTLLDLSKVAEINKAIQDTLIARPDGEVFDQVKENKSPTYVAPSGECNGCTYVLRDSGLNVMFQAYEVGPYSSGNIEVKIPQDFIANQQLKKVLKQSHGT